MCCYSGTPCPGVKAQDSMRRTLYLSPHVCRLSIPMIVECNSLFCVCCCLSEGHLLKVCNGRPALAGVYECRARNSAGSDSRSYELAFNPVTAPTPAVVDPTPDIKDTIIASLQAQLARANRRYGKRHIFGITP